MRLWILVLILAFPINLSAENHNVPIGTGGNRLIFSLKNDLSISLSNVQVEIQSTPEWIVFRKMNEYIKEIKSNQTLPIELDFRVLNTTSGNIDSVIIKVSDSDNKIEYQKILKFESSLSEQSSGIDFIYPNPANPETTIQFTLTSPAHVKLEIYNIIGQRVHTLEEGTFLAGCWAVNWNGTNNNGLPVSSGNYLVRLSIDDNVTGKINHYTSKLILQK